MTHKPLQFSIIICTYQRPNAITDLLNSLLFQTTIAKEIIIVDASEDDQTKDIIAKNKYLLPLRYFHVTEAHKGLTKQRNFGISHLNKDAEAAVFLDDDVILEKDFLLNLLSTFQDENIIGCDGFITNENYWQPISNHKKQSRFVQVFEGYELQLAKRDKLRSILGLFPLNLQPGIIPLFGHGKSSLPPTGKMYEVDHIMGGITAYRTSILKQISFSTFFEGYGLYEDFDFSVRASRFGKLVTNTNARLSHHHNESGRPNKYRFGKMVVKNGWYVWRLKHPHPGFVNVLKWHLITLLLAYSRLLDLKDPRKRNAAWEEFKGRCIAWFTLLINPPKINRD